MHKCVRVKVHGVGCKRYSELGTVVEKIARERALEGSLYRQNQQDIELVVAGEKEGVEHVLDFVYEWAKADVVDCAVTVEALLKERDYRGIFRVID